MYRSFVWSSLLCALAMPASATAAYNLEARRIPNGTGLDELRAGTAAAGAVIDPLVGPGQSDTDGPDTDNGLATVHATATDAHSGAVSHAETFSEVVCLTPISSTTFVPAVDTTLTGDTHFDPSCAYPAGPSNVQWSNSANSDLLFRVLPDDPCACPQPTAFIKGFIWVQCSGEAELDASCAGGLFITATCGGASVNATYDGIEWTVTKASATTCPVQFTTPSLNELFEFDDETVQPGDTIVVRTNIAMIANMASSTTNTIIEAKANVWFEIEVP